MYDSRRRLLKSGAGSVLAGLSMTAVAAGRDLASVLPTTAVAEASMTTRPPDAVFTGPDYQPGMLLHVVLFKYKPKVTAARKREVQRRFLALRESRRAGAGSPYILSITSGSQSSLEGVGQGFEQGYTVAFKSAGDRNYYVGQPVVSDPAYFDPEHEKFKAYVGPLLATQGGVLVFDYAVEAQA